MNSKRVAIIGGGPAGLAAAEELSALGHKVFIFEAMPTPARKLLLAGKSGLNISHAEDYDNFRRKFDQYPTQLGTAIDNFSPQSITDWAASLGVETFVGSSGRIFPKKMKASPLLRAWLKKLHSQGVELKTRHNWVGAKGNELLFQCNDEHTTVTADATILALGGASWPNLGSNAQWVNILTKLGIQVASFQPSNCGFDVEWSDVFIQKHAGAAIKSVAAVSCANTTKGEFVITAGGIEGSLVYNQSTRLRESLNDDASTFLELDLKPATSLEALTAKLATQDKNQSLPNRLRKGAKLIGAKAALVRETNSDAAKLGPSELAHVIKNTRIAIVRARPIQEAISCAGGIKWAEIDPHFMLKKRPGMFAAGEMIDWEAPTGGYLISGCLATGRAAAKGAHRWLANQ